jgi:hypothetical protein
MRLHLKHFVSINNSHLGLKDFVNCLVRIIEMSLGKKVIEFKTVQ